MKLVSKTLHYVCKSNEEPGMWTEKIICDILNIQFCSFRSYIKSEHYPKNMKLDFDKSLKQVLMQLRLKEHLGNKNEYYDFKTYLGETVSVKTNINGSKVCPQTIGQTTLNSFNKITNSYFSSTDDYKNAVINDTKKMVDLYLNYLFCCKYLLSFKYDRGVMYYLKKSDEKVEMKTDDIFFTFSRTLEEWNNSISLSVNLGDNVRLPFAEFQVHKTRNCIKCRFNMDTIVQLVNKGIIKNTSVEEHRLKYKYIVKVSKDYVDSEISESE